jgi:hypothetical protein
MHSSFARFFASAIIPFACLVLGLGCEPDPHSFYARTFTCDETTGADRCGTTQSGQAMTCFAASQLGGQDFCTATCDGDVAASSTAETVCLDSKADLERCHPSQGGQGCPENLSCFRTDLIEDDGVCLEGELCSANTDCPTVARTTCATTLLQALYPNATLALDHLNCVQAGCHARGTNCLPGEVCLPDVLPPQSSPPDICVPQCDAKLNCPPNYLCYQRVSGPAAPAVCLPGLLGFRCDTDNDCLLGDCVFVDEDYKVCSLACQLDSDCSPYDGQDYFFCAPPSSGASLHCMSPNSFGGGPCRAQADCSSESICTFYSPYHTNVDLGICLLPCNADLTCPVRGGIPQTCFDYLASPVCYPGLAGLYCRSDNDCIAGLHCLPAPEINAGEILANASICTVDCAVDQDCRAIPTGATTWCDQGICVNPRSYNRVCTRSLECLSGACVLSDVPSEQANGVMRCTLPPGGAE